RLHVARRTVATHVERLLAKLGASNRAAAATIAMDRQLFALPVVGPVATFAPTGPLSLEVAVRDGSRIRSSHRRARRRPLVVGAIYPANRELRQDGTQMKKGAALAIDEVNEWGGIGGRPLLHVP